MEKIPSNLLGDESGYPFTGIKPPSWLEILDHEFAGQELGLLDDPLFRAASNLARRNGDLDLYLQWLVKALNQNPSPWWCAAFATSIMVGYFSTGESLLDAGSIALTHIYGLALKPKEQDSSKGKSWNALEKANVNARDRFLPYKPLIQRAIGWRDVVVHRLPPRVRVLVDGPPTKKPDGMTKQNTRLGVPENPETDIGDLIKRGAETKWIDPLRMLFEFSEGFHELSAALAAEVLEALTRQRAAGSAAIR